jgi:L-fuculose-phosphate aldolase
LILDFDSFAAAGHDLGVSGLIQETSGNISIRSGNSIFITRHGARLDRLVPSDIVEAAVCKESHSDASASWELPVHRAIYLLTPAMAVVHAHPPCIQALSLVDNDGLIGVPSIGEKHQDIVAGILSQEIARSLAECPVIIVKGHGTFAVGQTLDEAVQLTLALESDATDICRMRGLDMRST